MNDRHAEPTMTHWNTDDDPNQDTITLLQAEIARLEAELDARDEAILLPAAGRPGDQSDDPDGREEAHRRRVEELAADLAGRDETVTLLLEQSRLFEDAAAAQRAEWEQLHQWVEEVERRVEGRDAGDDRLRMELDSERVRAESLRRSAESDRASWDAQRRGLEREAEHFRDLLARQANGPAAAEDETAFIALASENRRLRAASAELERLRAGAGEAEGLARKVDATLAELGQVRGELQRSEDERRRETIEHEAALVALRSETARGSLVREGVPGPAAVPSPTDADERIRAFRLHLKELHEREDQQRAGRTLSARLSRLWRTTGPG